MRRKLTLTSLVLSLAEAFAESRSESQTIVDFVFAVTAQQPVPAQLPKYRDPTALVRLMFMKKPDWKPTLTNEIPVVEQQPFPVPTFVLGPSSVQETAQPKLSVLEIGNRTARKIVFNYAGSAPSDLFKFGAAFAAPNAEIGSIVPSAFAFAVPIQRVDAVCAAINNFEFVWFNVVDDGANSLSNRVYRFRLRLG